MILFQSLNIRKPWAMIAAEYVNKELNNSLTYSMYGEGGH